MPTRNLLPLFAALSFAIGAYAASAADDDPGLRGASPILAPAELPPAKPPFKLGPMPHTTNPLLVLPMGPAPAWAPDIDPQMLAVIEELQASEPPTQTRLTPFQFRNAVSAAEAVDKLVKKVGQPPMPPKSDLAQGVLPAGPPEGLFVRTYTPVSGTGPFPVIVYFHGGGWVIADLRTYEAGAQALAEKAGAIVVSVAYRLAPEFPFPTAHEDAFAAYRWVVANAAQLNGDPNRIATAGESAGGNLAVAVALMARDRGVRLPRHIVSVYPIADGDTVSPSYLRYADAQPLSKPLAEYFLDRYVPAPEQRSNELISLMRANLAGLPPTTIINAQIDPLASDGEELAAQLTAQGVPVLQRTFQGVTHEFFGMAAVLEQAADAQNLAAKRLREAFAAAP